LEGETSLARLCTPSLRLFATGSNYKVLVLYPKAIIEPVVPKYLPRVVKYGDFAIFGSADGERPRLTIDDRGLIKALVLVSMPKHDPYVAAMLDVTFQAFQRNGELDAREVSIHRSR